MTYERLIFARATVLESGKLATRPTIVALRGKSPLPPLRSGGVGLYHGSGRPSLAPRHITGLGDPPETERTVSEWTASTRSMPTFGSAGTC